MNEGLLIINEILDEKMFYKKNQNNINETMIKNKNKKKNDEKDIIGAYSSYLNPIERDEELLSIISYEKDKYRKIIFNDGISEDYDFKKALLNVLIDTEKKLESLEDVRFITIDNVKELETPSFDFLIRKVKERISSNAEFIKEYRSFFYSYIKEYIKKSYNIDNKSDGNKINREDSNDVSKNQDYNCNSDEYNDFLSFDNIIGQDKAVEKIRFLCDSLLLYVPSNKDNPAKPFSKNILIYGEPGIGKSFVVKVSKNYINNIAKILNLKFKAKEISGNNFSSYIWNSEKLLHKYYEEITNPEGIGLIIFDEAETIFPKRSFNDNSKAYDSLTGEVLRLLDGYSTNDNYNNLIFFISNRPKDGLDEALLSRINLKIRFNNNFSQLDYKKMIELYINRFSVSKENLNFSIDYLTERANEMKVSPRDIKNIVSEISEVIKKEAMSKIFGEDSHNNRNYNLSGNNNNKDKICNNTNKSNNSCKSNQFDFERIKSIRNMSYDERLKTLRVYSKKISKKKLDDVISEIMFKSDISL